jgi:hypothetical protein
MESRAVPYLQDEENVILFDGVWLSTTETALATAHGLYAPIISPIAGVGEILLGGALLFFRNKKATRLPAAWL